MKSRVSQKMAKWLKSSLATLSLLSILIGSVQFLSATTTVDARSPVATSQKRPVVQKPNSSRLPAKVKTAVVQAYSRLMNIPAGRLKILSFSQETWPDTCLGLGGPAESCGTVLVEGWRVEVGTSSGGRFYRTDNTGAVVRLEELDNLGSLPQAVGQKVLAIAAKELGVPVNQLKVAFARPQLWDGCLGVAGPEQPCTMIGIPGWQAIVTGPQQYAVYHLNQNATMIKRNPTTSGKGTIALSFWQPDPGNTAPNGGEVILQSMTTGGIAGQAYKTLLSRDGRVIRIDLRNQSSSPTLVRQLSAQQTQQFVRFLQQNEFGDFLGFNYSPTNGADYFTIALMTSDGTRGVQYADMIQDQTPAKLQRTIQAWNCITNPQTAVEQCFQ